jgi:hypothetical protein
MLQLVQSRPEGYFSSFVSHRVETATPEKFVAYRDGGLKGRLLGFGLLWGGLSGCSRLLAGSLESSRISRASLRSA